MLLAFAKNETCPKIVMTIRATGRVSIMMMKGLVGHREARGRAREEVDVALRGPIRDEPLRLLLLLPGRVLVVSSPSMPPCLKGQYRHYRPRRSTANSRVK